MLEVDTRACTGVICDDIDKQLLAGLIMMSLGIAELTDKTLKEALLRLEVYSRLYKEDVLDSVKLLRNSVGLKANIHPKTRAAWLRSTAKNACLGIERSLDA